MNIRYLFISYVAATLITAFSLGSARATVLYQHLPVGSYNTGAIISSIGSGAAFDDFTLAEASTVTSISWVGRFSAPGDEFTIGFYESDAQPYPFTAPDIRPFFELTGTATDALNPLDPVGSARDYTLDLGAGVSLEADTNYFVSIQNVSTSFWQWQSDRVGLGYFRNANGNSGLFGGAPFFALEGEVNGGEPTVALAGPPAAAILALGLIGISTTRRRRAPTHGKLSPHTER